MWRVLQRKWSDITSTLDKNVLLHEPSGFHASEEIRKPKINPDKKTSVMKSASSCSSQGLTTLSSVDSLSIAGDLKTEDTAGGSFQGAHRCDLFSSEKKRREDDDVSELKDKRRRLL